MHDIDTMYLTKKDLAKSLNVSLSTIDRRLKELPHYKWGNKPQSRVVFVAREVRDYFDSNYSVNKKGRVSKMILPFIVLGYNNDLSEKEETLTV